MHPSIWRRRRRGRRRWRQWRWWRWWRWWRGFLVHLKGPYDEPHTAAQIAISRVHAEAVKLLPTLRSRTIHQRRAVWVRLDVFNKCGEQIKSILSSYGALVALVRRTAVHNTARRNVFSVVVHHRQLWKVRIRHSANGDRDVGAVIDGFPCKMCHSEVSSRHQDFLRFIVTARKSEEHPNGLRPCTSNLCKLRPNHPLALAICLVIERGWVGVKEHVDVKRIYEHAVGHCGAADSVTNRRVPQLPLHGLLEKQLVKLHVVRRVWCL